MRLTWLSLEKNMRRLWPAVVVTWIMLGALTNADRWRTDSVASSLEGWMNPMLTFAWASLVALAVLEEPLVGSRNFWTTRPYRWPSLLFSKIAFVALTIHLPLFLSDAFVLSTHGFSPLAHIGDLLRKQALFFAVLTLPSIAVASLVRSFTQFVIVAFITAAGLAILSANLSSYPIFYQPESAVRQISLCLTLAIPALVVVLIQYARRRIMTARIVAITAAMAAALLFARMPVTAGYAVRGEPLTLQRDVHRALLPATANRGYNAGLPIEIEKAGGGSHLRMPVVEAEITTAHGVHFRSVRPAPSHPFNKSDFLAWANPMWSDQSPDTILFRLSPRVWQQLGADRVNIRGVAAIDFYKIGKAIALPMDHATDIPDVGRCSIQIARGGFGDDLLKILCESPRQIPSVTVTLRSAASGRIWQGRLKSQFTPTQGPRETWLSPLHRDEVYFHVIDISDPRPGSQWLISRAELSSLRIELTPQIITGYSLAHFEFRDIDLASFRRAVD